jgi:Protein of unknown function (DUF1488)
MPFFTFPGEPRWSAERDAVEFEVQLGEYRGLVVVPRRLIRSRLGHAVTVEQCVGFVHLHRTEFERVAEAKLRARALDADANVTIDGRDLRHLGPS